MKTQDIKNIALALKDIREGAIEEAYGNAPSDDDADQMKQRKALQAKKNHKEDNSNDVSDDGDGLDKVQPKAVKKKFKDRKDKDIDNDGDTDSSDKFLHKRRKAVSKAIASKKKPSAEKDADVEMQEGIIGNLAKAGAKAAGRAIKKQGQNVVNKVADKTGVTTAKKLVKKVGSGIATVKKAALTGEEVKEAATQKPNNGADAEDGLSPNGKKMMAMKTDAPEGADITKVAPKTFAAMRASGKKAAMRNNDNAQGDKTPPKNDGK